VDDLDGAAVLNIPIPRATGATRVFSSGLYVEWEIVHHWLTCYCREMKFLVHVSIIRLANSPLVIWRRWYNLLHKYTVDVGASNSLNVCTFPTYAECLSACQKGPQSTRRIDIKTTFPTSEAIQHVSKIDPSFSYFSSQYLGSLWPLVSIQHCTLGFDDSSNRSDMDL
jgi:hypothetical protein